ncbi:MAG: phospholipase D family protein [Proteobacteria bacterium]|nr:phospholipase D family protein [Pseudomonadota bacterium]
MSTDWRPQNATALEAAIAPLAAAHPGCSGIHPLPDGLDAFAARMLLARAAQRTLDVQYYIWDDDKTGALLFDALRTAADRGVRVRLLLDDHNTAGLDEKLAELDTHANLEVRLFNPLRVRRPRWINYLIDFTRVNRRMHNKSITADAAATIIGGRNVSDRYFDAAADMAFADLDVLAVGPVARDVATDFDRYWNSDVACPVQRLLPRPTTARCAELAAQATRIECDPAAAAYMRAVHALAAVRELLQGQLALEWAPVRLLSDDPGKALGRARGRQHVSYRLDAIIGEAASSFDLVSAYFVPTSRGVDAFAQLAQRGVKIRVLTNSLAATDVAAVHAGYAKYRKRLLRAGIALFEWRPSAQTSTGRQRLLAVSGSRFGRSSVASLHAKTFSVDRRSLFVGSFNFDPRSARLNTEMGVVIDSPALACRVEAGISQRLPQSAWQVVLAPNGRLQWLDRRDGKADRSTVEPKTHGVQRFGIWLLSLLPIEWLL